MTVLKNKTPELLKLFALVAIALFAIVLLFEKSLEVALFRVGSVITIGVVLLWIYFEKIGWRQPFFRIGGWLCKTPDLRGRWEGEVDRGDSVGPHKFVMEIHQTYSHLECYAYSSRSESRTLNATFLVDDSEENFQFVHTWECKAGKLEHEKYDPGKFYGTSILNYRKGKHKILEGTYFTDRPMKQTRGKIKVTWRGYDLYSCFDKDAE